MGTVETVRRFGLDTPSSPESYYFKYGFWADQLGNGKDLVVRRLAQRSNIAMILLKETLSINIHKISGANLNIQLNSNIIPNSFQDKLSRDDYYGLVKKIEYDLIKEKKIYYDLNKLESINLDFLNDVIGSGDLKKINFRLFTNYHNHNNKMRIVKFEKFS